MKVLFVASECTPFAKTGGLGEVIGALPKALRNLGLMCGWSCRSTPACRGSSSNRSRASCRCPCGSGRRTREFVGRLPGSQVPVYCLEHHRYYDRPHLYGTPLDAYPDNLERFAFLLRGALEVTRALGWIPDAIHAQT